MNKKQLDNLSASLSKAINPAARKIEATAKILERIEPLPVVSKLTQEAPTPSAVGAIDPQLDRFSHEQSVDVSVESTTARMTTVAKGEPSPWPMATVVNSATVAELTTDDNLTTAESLDNLANLANLADVKGELRVPNTMLTVCCQLSNRPPRWSICVFTGCRTDTGGTPASSGCKSSQLLQIPARGLCNVPLSTSSGGT